MRIHCASAYPSTCAGDTPAFASCSRTASEIAWVWRVEVPLQKILEVLPVELQPRVRNPHVGDATISLPLDKVLSQLSRGAVRLSFGELRQAAPSVFSSETDRDRVLVQLPLNEILAQLNPALIARRRVQKQQRRSRDQSHRGSTSKFGRFDVSLLSQIGSGPDETS